MTQIANRFVDLTALSPEVRIKVENALAEQQQPEPTYMENFKKLKGASTELMNMQEPDVDMVIPLVEQGLNAYKNCSARIKQVEAYLGEINTGDEPVEQ